MGSWLGIIVFSCFVAVGFFLKNLSASLPKSIFSKKMVMMTVRTMEIITIAVGLSQFEKYPAAMLPKNAPATVIESLPRKNAVKNFARLYFIRPSGMTMGSSGIGVAAAKNSRRNAQRLTFDASASKRACLFSLRCLLTKNVIP